MKTHSEKQTIKFGKEFSKKLQGGEVLALIGNLGSGKTVFTKGLAKGLGVKKNITSPTFVLMKNYKINQNGINNFVHVDAYRLDNSKELKDIGIKDWFNKKDTVVVVEWADKVKDILPKNTKFIHFKQGSDNKEIRKIKIK